MPQKMVLQHIFGMLALYVGQCVRVDGRFRSKAPRRVSAIGCAGGRPVQILWDKAFNSYSMSVQVAHSAWIIRTSYRLALLSVLLPL